VTTSRTQITRTLLTLTAATLLIAGCGGGSDEAPNSAAPSSGAPASTAAPELTDQQAPPTRLVVDVTIKEGQVTPTNEALQSALNEPIVFRVLSDATDVLHVHSSPEHTFAIDSKQEPQQFQFTATVPGKIDVELHDLGKTVATITVQ
jgi:hypothetical protein